MSVASKRNSAKSFSLSTLHSYEILRIYVIKLHRHTGYGAQQEQSLQHYHVIFILRDEMITFLRRSPSKRGIDNKDRPHVTAYHVYSIQHPLSSELCNPNHGAEMCSSPFHNGMPS